MPEPTVDVGIPTRGNAPYLREAIESVLAQTSQGWRLTVSQNGEGLARSVVDTYLEDPRIRFAETGANLPMGESFSRLVQGATAPYVALLHDDDRWRPNFLQHHIAFLEEHPECGLVFSPSLIIDENGRSVGATALSLEPGVYAPERIWPILYRANVIPVVSVLVRRSAYTAVGDEYNPSIGFVDHEMWLRIAAHAPVGVLDVRDGEYRIHRAQASAHERLRQGAKRRELLDAIDAQVERGELTMRVDPAVWSLTRAEVHLCSALDSLEAGDRGDAVSHVLDAVRTHPKIVTRPGGAARIGAVATGLALGPLGRRLVSGFRRRRWETGGARAA
jgi:hypothetical protein